MAVISSAGLPLPARQRTVGGDDLVGRVDFLYEAERVVIECDGRRHHFGKVDAERDRWRDLELSAAGWVVIRVTWWQLVHQPERFTAQLRQLLDRRSEPAPRTDPHKYPFSGASHRTFAAGGAGVGWVSGR